MDKAIVKRKGRKPGHNLYLVKVQGEGEDAAPVLTHKLEEAHHFESWQQAEKIKHKPQLGPLDYVTETLAEEAISELTALRASLQGTSTKS